MVPQSRNLHDAFLNSKMHLRPDDHLITQITASLPKYGQSSMYSLTVGFSCKAAYFHSFTPLTFSKKPRIWSFRFLVFTMSKFVKLIKSSYANPLTRTLMMALQVVRTWFDLLGLSSHYGMLYNSRAFSNIPFFYICSNEMRLPQTKR